VRVSILLGLIALCLLPQRPAAAWHATGHMAVAAIAYRNMDPGSRKRAADVLRRHPHFASMWRSGLTTSGVPQDLYLFLRASTWADEVRNNPRYHRPTWHYVNRPYTPGGPREFKAPAENVITALYLNRQRFVNTSLPAADRAVALCWIFHLIGDLHQPFHSVAYVSDEFPQGDRGGNLFFVKTAAGPTNLHSLWDGLFDSARGLKAADDLGRTIAANRKKASLPELETRSSYAWAEESYRLAISTGYGYTSDPQRPSLRTPLKPANSAATAEPLPDGYEASARANAERRIAIAGYRLASVVGGLFYGQP
jgi:hypothetical protein